LGLNQQGVGESSGKITSLGFSKHLSLLFEATHYFRY